MFKFKWHKKELILLGMVGLVICLGVVNNKLSSNNSLSTNAEYTQYEKEQLSIHDGEVLVDSSSLRAVATPGAVDENTAGAAASIVVSKTETEKIAEKDAENQPQKMNDATLVTSDNYQELQSAGAYFEEARSSINMDRNEIMSMLTEVIETYGDSEAPEKSQAMEQKLKIIDYMNKEKMTEDILKTKGFAKVFVLMTDNSVNVTIDKQDVNKSDIAKIVDVITRETGRKLDQIVIQSKY